MLKKVSQGKAVGKKKPPLGTFFSILLALPLLVPRILAQHPHDTFSANHFTF